jgi:hypothetical protein
MRPRTFDDHFASIEPIVVNTAAPQEVRDLFDAARRLLVMA